MATPCLGLAGRYAGGIMRSSRHSWHPAFCDQLVERRCFWVLRQTNWLRPGAGIFSQAWECNQGVPRCLFRLEDNVTPPNYWEYRSCWSLSPTSAVAFKFLLNKKNLDIFICMRAYILCIMESVGIIPQTEEAQQRGVPTLLIVISPDYQHLLSSA